jgi:hypothetical protein
MNHFCKNITENVLYSVRFKPVTTGNYKICKKEVRAGFLLWP